MRVTTVEELIIQLESYEPEQPVRIGTFRGKLCLDIIESKNIERVSGTISIPSEEGI